MVAELTTYNGELGDVADWERDLGIVGGLSSLITPLLAFNDPIVHWFALVSAVFGVVTGRWLGRRLPRWLAGPYRHTPLSALAVLMLVAGGLWGAVVGTLGGLLSAGPFFILGTICAAPCGAMQLGWLWLPYTSAKVRGKSTRWLVVLAGLAPVLGGLVLHWLTGGRVMGL